MDLTLSIMLSCIVSDTLFSINIVLYLFIIRKLFCFLYIYIIALHKMISICERKLILKIPLGGTQMARKKRVEKYINKQSRTQITA